MILYRKSLLIDYLFLVIAIFLLPGSMYLIATGFHNMDMGHNLRYLEQKYDDDLMDMGSDGIVRELEDYIVIGHKQMILGIFLMMIASIIIGGHLMQYYDMM